MQPQSSTPARLNPGRLALLFGAQLALLFALWAGLLRLPFAWPGMTGRLPALHGPLMVSGFVGALVALERAVALARLWGYLAPLTCLLGTAALLAGLDLRVGVSLYGAGSLLFLAVQVVLTLKQPSLPLWLMAAGAIAWLSGNLLWLSGRGVAEVTSLWGAFFVLTIGAERLLLSRILRPSRAAVGLFLALLVLYAAALGLSAAGLAIAPRLVGAALVALALWLLRHDIARLNLRRPGLPRFSALALLGGYFWLVVSGAIGLAAVVPGAGLLYDALLHSLFVGFVLSMIFGHAPIIFPSILGRPIPFTRAFFVPLAALHLSLVLRVAGDLFTFVTLRRAGALINTLSVLLFFGVTLAALRLGRSRK
ncbi:MAG: hypothetical protein IT371_27665 [Deltaproteobacteria bacterium]|nr:hypothetical protein [Deltaproteobacteria bacterium]